MDYMILNPNMMTSTRNEEGHIIMLAHTTGGAYLSIDDFDRLVEAGKITVHNVNQSALAAAFGRVQVAYTIN